MRRALRVLVGLATFAVACAVLAQEALPPELELTPRFVIGQEGTRPYDENTPPQPGETIGLALAWPDGLRPAQPSLAGEAASGAFRARRLVLADPRADGDDIIEVLLGTLEGAQLPALALVDEGGETIAKTRPLTLEVRTALDAEESEPAPTRPPASIRPDFASLLIVLVVAALVAGALTLLALWTWRRLRARGEEIAPPSEPSPPPEVRALDALEALLAERLLERDLHKPFSVRLAEIGKGYIGEVAELPLLERTTEECARELANAGFADARVRWLERFLTRLDLVKFAGDRPPTTVLAKAAEELRAMIVEDSAERARAESPELELEATSSEPSPDREVLR